MGSPDLKEVSGSQVDASLAELVTRAEYDVQIATAKRYPRSIKEFVNRAGEMVTLNEGVAQDCVYALPRDGKTIEGPSARFAEIILHAWGHTRAGARIVNEDSRFVTAQGVCHDLQSNTLIAYEVRRRITKSNGAKYNDDMVGVTGNAASSIALRNAILKVIPKAFWEPLYLSARKIIAGDSKTLVNRRAEALDALQKVGATKEMVLTRLALKGVEDITIDHLVALRGMLTAIREGDSTVEQMFAEEKPEAASKTDAIKDKLKAQQWQPGYNLGGKPVDQAEKPSDKSESGAAEHAAPPAAGSIPSPAPAEAALTLQDYLDDIRTVPTLEGLSHKTTQALDALSGDAKAVAAVNHASGLRRKSLTPKADPSSGGQPTQAAQSQDTGKAPSSLEGHTAAAREQDRK